MQVTRTNKSATEVQLDITADTNTLNRIHDHILREHLAKDVKIPGFREGKAPINLIEKHVDQGRLQSQFIEEAVTELYDKALLEEKLRAIDRPQIEVTKFVPFSTLVFRAKVPVIGEVTLPDYRKVKVSPVKAKPVTEKDIEAVLDSIKTQVAEKKDVERPSRDGDQLWIDFSGRDDDGKPVSGASAKDYPIIIGSNTFIPGFEPNLIGLKGGSDKTFTVKFPKDYQLKALSNRDVTFDVHVTKVQEVVEAEIDNDLVAKVSPFKTVNELNADIREQLKKRHQVEADREYESLLLKAISEKSKVAIPEILVNNDIEKKLDELKRNLVYRGQTFQEFLKAEAKTEEEYKNKVIKPESEERLKASIVLSEIAEREGLNVTSADVDERIAEMKKQYTDTQAQTDLDKPEARNEAASRILAEKTIFKLISYSPNK